MMYVYLRTLQAFAIIATVATLFTISPVLTTLGVALLGAGWWGWETRHPLVRRVFFRLSSGDEVVLVKTSDGYYLKQSPSADRRWPVEVDEQDVLTTRYVNGELSLLEFENELERTMEDGRDESRVDDEVVVCTDSVS